MKAIIVDDSLVIRTIIEKTLKSIGYDTLHAVNGQEALDLLEKQAEEVELVILDWNMPVLNGWDALKTLRGNKACDHICVLMVSTESEGKKINEALSAGAQGYLTKPFSAEKLTEKLQITLQEFRSN